MNLTTTRNSRVQKSDSTWSTYHSPHIALTYKYSRMYIVYHIYSETQHKTREEIFYCEIFPSHKLFPIFWTQSGAVTGISVSMYCAYSYTHVCGVSVCREERESQETSIHMMWLWAFSRFSALFPSQHIILLWVAITHLDRRSCSDENLRCGWIGCIILFQFVFVSRES